jgi:Kef-type K+ transport system membrane component KefB
VPHLEHNALTLLLLQIVVIITLSRVLMVGAKRLGQPLVIAEVVAGILLGPSFLGAIAPGAMAFLFPTSSLPLLKMLSQFGLVLFMFLVGLELDPQRMKGRAKASVAISWASIGVPFVLGTGLALAMYDRYSAPSVRLLPFVLFIGIAMSITAFPVLARILSERRLLGTRLGAVAIACAAVDDVTAWCLLALVVAVTRLDSLAGFGWTVGLTLAFIALMLFGLRPFLKRLAQRTPVSGDLSQSAVVATLVMLLMCSGVTELIGIHALFGAFLFGVAMPKERGFASALAERFETVAVTLLLPLFFAFSGLRTQLGLLSSPTDWGLTLLIVVLATVGKFGGSAIASKLTGVGWREAAGIGILMNTRGLVELVVLNIGYDLGVINSTVFTMFVLMALVTTFATSPLIGRVFPERELLKERLDDAAGTGPHEPKGLLICVSDANTGAGLALVTAALHEASGGAEATALHLYPPTNRPSVEQRNAQRTEGESPLGLLLNRARALGQRVRPLTFVSSEPAQDICRTAEAKQASLVLLAASIAPWSPRAKTTAAVTARATSPVAVLIDRGLERTERVLIALTGTQADAAALVLARHIGPARPKPVRLEELATELKEADLVLVGAGPRAAQLEPMLEGSRASVLWVHPAQSRALTEDAGSLEPSHTVA